MASEGPLPSARSTELLTRLDKRKQSNECPFCKRRVRWVLGAEPVRVDDYEAVLLMCNGCGFMRSHAALILDGGVAANIDTH